MRSRDVAHLVIRKCQRKDESAEDVAMRVLVESFLGANVRSMDKDELKRARAEIRLWIDTQ